MPARKQSFECLRRMRRALLDALKHLNKSIDDVDDPHGVFKELYDGSFLEGIKTSNFSPPAGLGPSRRPGRLKKCILCEDGPIPEELGRRAPDELLQAQPDADPPVLLVPYIEVQSADGSVSSLFSLVEQIDAWPVLPQAIMEEVLKGDGGSHEAVGGASALRSNQHAPPPCTSAARPLSLAPPAAVSH